jgi:C4-dicarboxylate transporter DctQ subunit
MTVVAILISLAYCGLFIYGGWIYLAKMKKIGIELEDLPIPVWLAHGMLVVGMIFLSIRLLQLMWAVVMRGQSGFHHEDEAKESMRLAERMRAEEKGVAQ